MLHLSLIPGRDVVFVHELYIGRRRVLLVVDVTARVGLAGGRVRESHLHDGYTATKHHIYHVTPKVCKTQYVNDIMNVHMWFCCHIVFACKTRVSGRVGEHFAVQELLKCHRSNKQMEMNDDPVT